MFKQINIYITCLEVIFLDLFLYVYSQNVWGSSQSNLISVYLEGIHSLSFSVETKAKRYIASSPKQYIF